MLTEDEAREKWCPMARHISTVDEGSCANRWSGGKGGEIDNPAECRCIASQCMAFRWVPDAILPLGNGLECFFDNEDRDILNYSWWWDGRYVKGDKGYLHRHIVESSIGSIPDGMFVDHIDGNPLNNRRRNLRVVTKAENAANSAARGGKSQYRGVSQSRSGRWVAQISKAGVRICLGTFDAEEEAAKAYDDAARIIHGDFARLNLAPIENSGRRGYCGAFGRPGDAP